jgi:hypothetical protein
MNNAGKGQILSRIFPLCVKAGIFGKKMMLP